MPFSFKFQEIRPGPFRYKQLISALTTSVFRIGRRMKRDYESTVSTWKERPTFEILTQRSSNIAAVLVGTDNTIYRFLNDGTKVRYATMSRDWESKSKVRVLNSYPGRGKREFVSLFHPQRGIAPREWSIVIEEKYNVEFPAAIEEALERAVIATGHAI